MNLADEGRILYVSMTDVSVPDGPGVNEREFLLSLYSRLGDRVHALVPRPRRRIDEIDRRRTTFFANSSRWNVSGLLVQQFELYRRLQPLVSSGRFDLVVVRLSLFPLALYQLRRMPTPFVLKTLEDSRDAMRNNKGLKGAIARVVVPLSRRMFRSIVQHAAGLDACTEALLKRHREDFGLAEEAVQLIQNATNVERFQPHPVPAAKRALGLDRFDQIIGYVGGEPAKRGGLQMLEIAARLRGNYPKLGVVIAGRDTADLLKRRAEQLGLEDRTLILGLIPYETVPDYVNCFDVGFALDQPERMLAVGNSYQKVRQYLACGKAVVTCAQEQSELAQRGLVENVAPDDLTAIERSVRRLLNCDAEARAGHSARAIEFIRERCSTQATLEQRLEFWDQRLRTAAPRRRIAA